VRVRQEGLRKEIVSYLGISGGVLITAAGLCFFLVPNRIAAGGVSGLATVLLYLANLPMGVTMLLLNIPLFILSMKIIGPMFGVKTLFGSIALSVAVDFMNMVAFPLTTDPLLAAIYGGVVSGIGLGLAFRFGGSTGGTDMAAQLVARYLPMSVGQALLLVDGIVILLAGTVFGPELAMYALLAVFVTTKAIDLIQEGQSYAKAVLIISDKADDIAQAVMVQMDRGVTGLPARGLYTNTKREMLLVTVARSEIARVKDIVRDIDSRAFVIIHDVHEVLGEGFRRL
jgi:uncharacterized membrane-anchored protein YitT (DUF2179 family)